ncbi:hypothetical protein ACIRCZ_17570 [Leifsonia sp. NPDC102414]|uniref:hypothetical protein n=1 Tax=Leifsonia sp. NPDC102414 TaxID=3364124 RepID=UPI00382CC4EB
MVIAAVVVLLAADVYFVVTTLVDLAPLNNVRAATRRERATEVAINGPIMLLPAILVGLAGVFAAPVLAVVGGAIETIVVAGGLLLWWLPYLASITVPWATAGTADTWEQLHARTYARTIIALPRIGDRPRPNLEHMILHALLLAGAILAFMAAAAIG